MIRSEYFAGDKRTTVKPGTVLLAALPDVVFTAGCQQLTVRRMSLRLKQPSGAQLSQHHEPARLNNVFS
jgi:hypothetical protein